MSGGKQSSFQIEALWVWRRRRRREEGREEVWRSLESKSEFCLKSEEGRVVVDLKKLFESERSEVQPFQRRRVNEEQRREGEGRLERREGREGERSEEWSGRVEELSLLHSLVSVRTEEKERIQRRLFHKSFGTVTKREFHWK